MIKRKSDLRSIVTDINKSSMGTSAYLMQNIKKNFNNFVTSDWISVTQVLTSQSPGWHRPAETSIPYKKDLELTVHSDELIKFLALPFVNISKNTVPNDSTVAFGSSFYSNDEQKAFALKHDMSIAKSPAKTQYYILTPDEEEALIRVISNKGDSAIKNIKISCIAANAYAIVDSVNNAFNTEAALSEATAALLRDKAASPSALGSNSPMNLENASGPTDHNPVQALIESVKHSWLGTAYKSPYKGLKIKEIENRGTIVETPHFVFDWSYNYRARKGIYLHGKSSLYFSDIATLFIQEATPDAIEKFKAGTPLPVTCLSRPMFEIRWQNKPGNVYYANNFRVSSEHFIGPLFTAPPISIDPAAKEHYEIIQSNDYYELENNYVILDRLVGFLSENPEINVVSSKVFRRQITESNPTLNIATYDSLYGMFRSDDENTRMTAAKMLQSFDLPQFDLATRGSSTYHRTQNLPVNPSQYALELAVDLLVHSEVTGASIDKWFVKNLGLNLSKTRRNYNRGAGYGSVGSYLWKPRYSYTEFNGVTSEEPNPSMPYADRNKFYEIQKAVSVKLASYFRSEVESLSKYWNLSMFQTSPCNNKELIGYCTDYTDLIARRDSLNSIEQARLGYLELFMRHYVEYTFSRYYLGQSLNLKYDLGILSPADLAKKVDDAFIHTNFSAFRSKFRAAKAKALENPVKYIEIITNNETGYRMKYLHNLAGYRSDTIPDYANQTFLRNFPKNYLSSSDYESTVPEIIEVFDYYIANL